MGAGLTRLTYLQRKRTLLWFIGEALRELGSNCLIWVILFTACCFAIIDRHQTFLRTRRHIAVNSRPLAYTHGRDLRALNLLSWCMVSRIYSFGPHWFFWPSIINLVLCKLIGFVFDISEQEISKWIYAIVSLYWIMIARHHIRRRNLSHSQSLTSSNYPYRVLLGTILESSTSFLASRRTFGRGCEPKCLSVSQHAAKLSSIPYRTT